MKRDLTLARIRNTDFPILYKKFILDCEITKLELKKILTIATIFLNSTNQNIQNLGYRTRLYNFYKCQHCCRINCFKAFITTLDFMLVSIFLTKVA